MADVLPPKRQIAVDRLRRRIESYRRHKINCIPRFDQSFNDLCQQNIQDTLILKQRFLENKVKRAAKKAEKKQPENTLQNVHSVPKFVPPKRTASDDLDRNESFGDQPPPKSQKPGSAPQPENVTKFAVEIIQQVEFTTTSSNSQISTNVTVKALNTSVKSDMGSGVQTTVSPQPQPHTPRNDIVECKQEQEENPEFVDLAECAAALEKDAAVNGGNSFPGFTDLIGDDTSDAIITSDAFKDLISEISDFPPEFMKEFDFDGGDKKVDCVQHHVFKTEEVDSKHVHHQQRSVMQTGVNQRMYSSGMDFSKTELSPAAQTLKQMAEQHQHKTQLGMSFNPSGIPGNKTPYNEYQYSSGSDFGSPGGNNSNQSGYKQPGMVTPTPPSSYVNSDSIKQEVFSAQNSPGVYSPGSAGKTSSGQSQARLGAGFNQQYSPYSSPGAHGSPQYTPRGQSQGGPPPNQAPPRPPSCPGTTTLQINQAQQLHISQAQGTPIQVSMAQNLSTDMKQGAVSIAAQQGMYFSQAPLAVPPNNSAEAYCTVSQSQTINFTQQTLRQRAPPRGEKIMHPQMIRPQQPQPQQMGVRPPPPEYKASPTQPMFHPMANQRGFSPTRRIAQQPIPPSGPMMRPQPPPQQQPNPAYMNMNMSNTASHQRIQYARPQRPQPMALNPETINSSSPEWRHLILAQQQQQQQQRLPFHQAQGVAFSGGGIQMSAAQMQQLSHMNQQQSLALQQNNAQMSVNLHMSQSMGGRSQLQNNQMNTYVSSAPSLYPSGYSNSNSFQHSSYPQLPSDLNLDFLEQLPTTDPPHFSEHELISSLESGASLNFQDLL